MGPLTPVRWLLFLAFDLLVLALVAVVVVAVVLDGRDLPAPGWVAEEAGALFSRGLGGGRADVGRVSVRMHHADLPQVLFHDVRLSAPDGTELAGIPELGVSLDTSALVQGRVQIEALRVSGAEARLRRDETGALDLGFGQGDGFAQLGSLEEAIGALRATFALQGLAPIRSIEVRDLRVVFEDLRAQQVWQIENAALDLDHEGDDLSIAVTAPLTLPNDPAGARLALRLSLDMDTAQAELSTLVEGVPAEVIATQAPALSWLEPLDAKVSGALIATADAAGRMGTINGTLEIGEGAFQPAQAASPVPFDSARAYFSYDPAEARVRFEQLSLDSPDGGVEASGHITLEGLDSGWPNAMVGQFQVSDLRVDRAGLFPEPARFQDGAVDLHTTLDPFTIHIGQAVLSTSSQDPAAEVTRLRASGKVTADADGWNVILDMGLDQIESEPLLALWPHELAPGTRRWVANNLISGRVHDAHAGLRFRQGERPDLALTFQFRDGTAIAMPSLPPIEGASGYASVGRHSFGLSIDSGSVAAPEGGIVDLSGASIRISNMNRLPRIAEVLWQSRSPVHAGLSLLDQPPFRFLSRANLPVGLAEGEAQLTGVLRFPMQRKIVPGEVDYDIAGTLTGLSSDVVVPNRTLVAERLSLRARPTGLEIRGAASLEDVPVEGAFTLPLGADVPPAFVEGTLEVGARAVENFGIGLPEGLVSGAGEGRFRVDLPKGQLPRFSLASDLRGVGLSLPALQYSKTRAATGGLDVVGTLGAGGQIDRILLTAPGLSAEGAITLTPEGGLDRARFSRVSLGGWLDAPVTLRGRGAGREPAVSVEGGTVDIRRTSMGPSGGRSAGGTGGPPIALSLDRVVVSEGLSLTAFRGELTRAGGLSGTFTGRVNGKAAVTGTLAPGRGGRTGVRVRSDNAGAVFKAAGLFEQGNGGSMTLLLTPRPEPGEYDGQLKVGNVRVRSASGLAALINAISVVGLIDELNGSGIVFNEIEALFRLTPSYVRVTRSSGVGPSLGISMEGVYDMVRDRLDMQGVFSPVYMVNSIGSIFTRKGEGLIGVTYRMRGSSANPSVEVNPLSAFTPGMFREIFRAPPPMVRGQN
ncbi:AsmA-like protein [Aliiruegeria haliotis]|uniref:AsmA-like protein n=1 Tax=Aliiruegeria haliotis TaxID=1280846 RepID=A0A2T0RNG1_9RHOB|nr:AsmA-like C-terminal region-containing protein [Aliiruegeria haliotis]PRY22681.1 AsmA-like protein [Aliiruegeria haliotis]